MYADRLTLFLLPLSGSRVPVGAGSGEAPGAVHPGRPLRRQRHHPTCRVHLPREARLPISSWNRSPLPLPLITVYCHILSVSLYLFQSLSLFCIFFNVACISDSLCLYGFCLQFLFLCRALQILQMSDASNSNESPCNCVRTSLNLNSSCP